MFGIWFLFLDSALVLVLVLVLVSSSTSGPGSCGRCLLKEVRLAASVFGCKTPTSYTTAVVERVSVWVLQSRPVWLLQRCGEKFFFGPLLVFLFFINKQIIVVFFLCCILWTFRDWIICIFMVK